MCSHDIWKVNMSKRPCLWAPCWLQQDTKEGEWSKCYDKWVELQGIVEILNYLIRMIMADSWLNLYWFVIYFGQAVGNKIDSH